MEHSAMDFLQNCFSVENANYDVESHGRIELDYEYVLSLMQRDLDVEESQRMKRGSQKMHFG